MRNLFAAVFLLAAPAAADPLLLTQPAQVEAARQLAKKGQLKQLLDSRGADSLQLGIDLNGPITGIVLTPTSVEIRMSGSGGIGTSGGPLDLDHAIARQFAYFFGRAKVDELLPGFAKTVKLNEVSFDAQMMLMAKGYGLDLSAKSEKYFRKLSDAEADQALRDEFIRWPYERLADMKDAPAARADAARVQAEADNTKRAYLKVYGALEEIIAQGRYVLVDYNLQSRDSSKPSPHGVVTIEDYETAYGGGAYAHFVGHGAKLDGVLVNRVFLDAVQFVQQRLKMTWDDAAGAWVKPAE